MTAVDTRGTLIRVAVPARADLLHLLRSVTGSVGARVSLGIDDLEELQIAVDEAATLLLEGADERGQTLHLQLESADRTLRASIRLEPGVSARPDDDPEGSWPWRVISGLTQDATIDHSPASTTISFTKTSPRIGR
jgi:serine/threonine-protein kinase RsbW